jgi:hypothetical protein
LAWAASAVSLFCRILVHTKKINNKANRHNTGSSGAGPSSQNHNPNAHPGTPSSATSATSQNASQSGNGAGGPNGNAPGVANQSAFINKLYTMLEDPNVHSLICWDPTGTIFIVHNPTDFAKTVLPQYFKHNNFASFVRQLNMYGFHKVNDSYLKMANQQSEVWEFKVCLLSSSFCRSSFQKPGFFLYTFWFFIYFKTDLMIPHARCNVLLKLWQHPDFRRGEVSLLQNIKRKASKSGAGKSITGGGSSGTPGANSMSELLAGTAGKDEKIEILSNKVVELEEKL